MVERLSRLIAPVALTVASMPAMAANPDLQNYFFQACTSATGALAARCGATPGGLGDLSGDSESSLAPTQNLSHTKSSSGLADVRSSEARGRASAIREGEDPVAAAATQVRFGGFNLLVNARATWFDRNRDPGVDRERGIDGDSWAIEVGVDRRVSERVFLGALATFESLQYGFEAEQPGDTFVPAANAGKADTDSQSVTLLAVVNPTEHVYVDAAVGYSRQKHEFSRNPVFQGAQRDGQFAARVAGDTDSRAFWFYANAGVDVAAGAATFGPFAGLTYSHSKIDSYSERDLNGSGLHMSFVPCSRDSLLGHIGLRADRAISTAHGVFVPQLRAEYQYEFRAHPLTQSSHFVLDSGASSVTLTGDRPSADRFNIGAGIAAILPRGGMAFLNFDMLAGSDLDRQRLSLGVRIEL
ncbi:MAG: autotransporter outer membrane beta-barrel domain-containing protein [Gammaproteobacteria bacterium]|nr:autotransporter outer membrane beta-barrel domain-containing protein [Gammaproteobacteria bacterium]